MKVKRMVTAIISLLLLSSFMTAQMMFCHAAPLSGAIFTTTPDGSIVNENVRYSSKLDVYLDGGPPPNAPASSAGLPDGWYVFQVTDPSGSVQLSEDPAKCRIVEVIGGVIVRLVKPHELGLDDCYKVGNGKNGICYPCHIQDEPDGVAGPSGRHDTNTDIDHGDDMGAIVVQLMPFLDTPNPGGVYKAWMMPLTRYIANGGNLEQIPAERGLVKKKGETLGFKPDIGFGPSRDQIKTDNFKVKEIAPPPGCELRVRKFHDLNANSIWDEGEPEIGTDQLIDGGGWPISITDPLSVTNNYFTPVLVLAEPPGEYIVMEAILPGWYQSATYLDGVSLEATNPVTVKVAGVVGEAHEVIFGNYMHADLCGKKFEDLNGNGVHDGGELGIPQVLITISGTDGLGNPVYLETRTDEFGAFCFTDLNPGTYTVTETVPAGWVPSTVTSIDVTLKSGDDVCLGYIFGNFRPVDIYAHKFFDLNENKVQDAGERDLAGIKICLTQDGNPVTQDAFGNPIQACQFTDADGMVYWRKLRPSIYTISEDLAGSLVVGLYPTTPTTVTVEIISGQAPVTVEFGNVGPCNGLTPGYWKNWRNHYTQEQFALLLKGTIADVGTDAENIVAADAIFEHWDASDPHDLTILKAFVLANQLTINLTHNPDLPNPSGGSLFYACSLTYNGETVNLGETLSIALEIINDPSSYDDTYILHIKDILDAFANHRTC